MTAIPELGAFSTHTQALDYFGANVGRSTLVKRMAILFDRLVFFPIGLSTLR